MRARRIARFFLFLILIGLGVSFWLLHQSFFQDFIAERLIERLSRSYQTRIELGRFRIKSFNRIEIQELYIEDQYRDTLYYADLINLYINGFSLWKKTVEIGKFWVNKSIVKIRRNDLDSVYNFSFLIGEHKQKPGLYNSSGWKIKIDKTDLTKVYFSEFDEVYRSEQTLYWDLLHMDSIDITQAPYKILVNRMVCYKPFYNRIIPLDSAYEVKGLKNGEKEKTNVSYRGPEVKVNTLNIEGGMIAFRNQNRVELAQGFDYSNVDIRSFSTDLSDILLKENRVQFTIDQLSFIEKSGFQVSNMHLKSLMSSSQLRFDEFIIQTPNSTVKSHLEFQVDQSNVMFQNPFDLDFKFWFEKSTISVEDLNLLFPSWLESIPLVIDNQARLSVDGRVEGEPNNIVFQAFHLALPDIFEIESDGRIRKGDQSEDLLWDWDISKLYVSGAQLERLLNNEGMSKWVSPVEIGMKARFSGTNDDVKIHDLIAHTSSGMTFHSEGTLNNVLDFNNRDFEFVIREMKTTASALSLFVPIETLPLLDSLGEVRYSGLISGRMDSISVAGDFITDGGHFKLDTGFILLEGKKYGIHGRVTDLEPDKFLLKGRDLSRVNFYVEFEGNGFTKDSIQFNLNAVIDSFHFRNRTYCDFRILGNYEDEFISGIVTGYDTALNLRLEIEIDLRSIVPEYSGYLDLHSVDFKELKLLPHELMAKGRARFSVIGDQLDNISGFVHLRDLTLWNDSLRYHSNEFNLDVDQLKENNNIINLNSDFANAGITGKFQLSKLDTLFRALLKNYFPEPGGHPSEWGNDRELLTSQFQFQANLNDPTLVYLIFPRLSRIDKAFLSGSFDGTHRNLNVSGKVDHLHFDKIGLNALQFNLASDQAEVRAGITVNDFTVNEKRVFEEFQLASGMQRDSVKWSLQITDSTSLSDLGLNGVITRSDDAYRLKLDHEIKINHRGWSVDPNHEIYITKNKIRTNHLNLKYRDNRVDLNGDVSLDSSNAGPFTIKFDNFQIQDVIILQNILNGPVEGLINGQITLLDLKTMPKYFADISIDHFRLKDYLLGNLSLKAIQDNESDKIDLAFALIGGEVYSQSQGYYVPKSQTVAINSVAHVPMSFIEVISPGMFRDSKGSLSGEMGISGLIHQPDIKGNLIFKGVEALLEVNNSRYKIDDQSISINNNSVDIETIKIRDENDDLAELSGRVLIDNFTNPRFNFILDANEFQFINTVPSDDMLFFGKLVADANLRFSGTQKRAKIDLTAQTKATSRMYLQPFADQSAWNYSDFVIYGIPPGITDPTRSEMGLSQLNGNKKAEMEFNVQFELTPDAVVHVIVDPVFGDELVCVGNASLNITKSPGGDFNALGTYVVESGNYSLNYKGLVRKQFEIQKGSQIIFPGDPMLARFAVSAVYQVRTDPYDLIKNESNLTIEEIEAARKPQLVHVVMNISGTLQELNIEFDIQFPESSQNELGNIIDRKLSSLRQDPNEINQQVFSLLVLNRFMMSERIMASVTGQGMSLAVSSLSKLITNQLNKLADQYLHGLEVNIDIESFGSQNILSGSETSMTQLQIDMAKKLFNKRLSVTAGGNINFVINDDDDFRQNRMAFVAGDFILDYRLTPTGTYILRVFRKTNYDFMYDVNTSKSGVGIFYKKSFMSRKNRGGTN